MFKVKRNSDGSVERFKARIVAKGYSQVKGLDYDETFAPVTRYDSLRLIIALALHLGLDMSQADIKSAFLNRDLNEEVWMMPPPGIGLDRKVHYFLSQLVSSTMLFRRFLLYLVTGISHLVRRITTLSPAYTHFSLEYLRSPAAHSAGSTLSH